MARPAGIKGVENLMITVQKQEEKLLSSKKVLLLSQINQKLKKNQ